VPAATCTVCPAVTLAAAALIVQNGWVAVPDPLSLQLGEPRSTYRTVPAAKPTSIVDTAMTVAIASTRPNATRRRGTRDTITSKNECLCFAASVLLPEGFVDSSRVVL
jgi:hypothetical protein